MTVHDIPAPPQPGEPAPWFQAAALQGAPRFAFHTAAGRNILLLFFGSARAKGSEAALRLVARNRDLFDDVGASFFGVTVDPADEQDGRIQPDIPGIRHFLDYDGAVSRLYGALATGDFSPGALSYRPFWLLLDSALRVIGRYPLEGGRAAIAEARNRVAAPSSPDWAPVLMVPDIFEPETCRELIALYERQGGAESGFMREVDGKTVLLTDPSHKRRRDCMVEDEKVRSLLAQRVQRRLVPMIKRAFQFEVTRMERYIVACYDAADGGHFRRHRDNTTKGTAHRRFAVTINLNADEYEGGDLRFPEYGARTYRPPTGGAVVFSCSLLHEAEPVTKGRRYAFLPFLYDEAAAEIREANNPYLDPSIGSYNR